MIIKRADGASSAQIVTVFISRTLVDILTLRTLSLISL